MNNGSDIVNGINILKNRLSDGTITYKDSKAVK